MNEAASPNKAVMLLSIAHHTTHWGGGGVYSGAVRRDASKSLYVHVCAALLNVCAKLIKQQQQHQLVSKMRACSIRLNDHM